ncbi:unnamed protein product [Cuscuta epithymum]|uniref:Molybdenum cofactor biosynthesis protein A-like twitch domain-containing protein n=1 Tax=Cuscuta epithymum TaxID=186058 RepID=A0AAV0DT69_9ASTE|nr:unnamed protein product [Cuscuta epithymum]
MLIFKKTKQVKRFTGLHRTLDNHIEISKNFRIHGHEGTVSFITALTEQLYAACNTLRLLSNADYKVCVVGPFEVSSREPLRRAAAAELMEIIGSAVRCFYSRNACM